MEYVKRIRCLENYVVRNIPDDLFYVDQNGEKKVDITNPRYYYGTIPNNVIDEEGNEILDINGQPIPNTINIDIFLTQKFDDIGIFSDTFLNDTKSTMSEEDDDNNEERYCPQLLDMSLDESNVPYISSQGVPLSLECCNFEVVQIKGVFWDGKFCRVNTNTEGNTNNNSSKCPTAYQVVNSPNKGIYITSATNQQMTSFCCTTKITNQPNVFWDGEFCRIKNNTGGSTIGSTKPVGVNNNNTVRS